MNDAHPPLHPNGIAGKVARAFIDSKLTPLIVITSVLLGIAALANELPQSQQRQAIRVGLILAYAFRVLALLVASWLTTNTWVRWLGAGYLLWLMSAHLTKVHAYHVADEVERQIPEEGASEKSPIVADSEAR